jgi:hypothetical protein
MLCKSRDELPHPACAWTYDDDDLPVFLLVCPSTCLYKVFVGLATVRFRVDWHLPTNIYYRSSRCHLKFFCGICEEHEGEKSKITLQWGPRTKRHFIRISFGSTTLASKSVESSSRRTRHTVQLAIYSAPEILRLLFSVFLQRHLLFRSAALVTETSSVFLVLLQ